jgi:phage terminase large subunit-like protein
MSSSDAIDFVARANGYIDAVLSRAQDACKYVRQACQRQRDDLERYADRQTFYFDEEAANRVCRFIQCLPHIKGPKANAKEKIELEPWQCFMLATVFGWRRADTHGRRYKGAYVEVARGNAKSTVSAALGLYCLAADDEEGAEVYAAATTSDQSDIVWSTARAMIEKNPLLLENLGIAFTKDSILQPRSNSKFTALSGRASTQDGLNIHAAIVDELHAHKTRELHDVLETACSKRESSLLFRISTAGTDTSGICYEVRRYGTRVLAGEVDDPAQFFLIYTLEEENDWVNPEAWPQANPNWGVSVIPDAFSSLATKAMQLPSAQNNFKTKHLNIWCNADQAWMDMRAWDRCADPTLTPEDFAKDACWMGLDLASKVDIAAKARLFVRMQPKPSKPAAEIVELQPGGSTSAASGELEPHYYLFLDCYLPEAAVTDGRNASYGGWQAEGRLVVTPGDVTDFGTIREDVLGDCARLKVKEVACDPWQATQLLQELQAKRVTCVEVRPLVSNFSEPMKTLDALVRTGRLHHDGNPVLRWMVSNTVCHTDAKDNIYPRKERVEAKIDGVIATLLALSRALRAKEAPAARPNIRFL